MTVMMIDDHQCFNGDDADVDGDDDEEEACGIRHTPYAAHIRDQWFRLMARSDDSGFVIVKVKWTTYS